MRRLGNCFKTVFTADDEQLINSVRQFKGYSLRRFLKVSAEKLDVQTAEDLTTCFQTLTNMGLRKELQAVANRTLWIRLVLNM